MVKRINAEVESMSAEIKEKLPKIYSKELIDLLFYEFYTKIVYIENGLSVTRKTAVNYLLKQMALKNRVFERLAALTIKTLLSTSCAVSDKLLRQGKAITELLVD